MPTRRMLPRFWFPACLIGMWTLMAYAAEEAPADVREISASQPAADEQAESDEEGAEENPEEDASTEGTVAGQMGEVSLEEFVPSEEISADGAVSFPVDI